MNNHDLVLILKVKTAWYNEIDFSNRLTWPLQLKKRIEGHWKVNFNKVSKVKFVIALYNGKVLSDYFLGNKFTIERDTQRITDLELTPANNATQLVNKQLIYKTRNPATIKSIREINNLIDSDILVDINYDTSFGDCGTATATVDDEIFEFSLYQDHSNQYGDVYLEVISDDFEASCTLYDIYNSNSLPDYDIPGYKKIMNELDEEINSAIHTCILDMVNEHLDTKNRID